MLFQPKDPNFEQKVKSSFERQGFIALIGAELAMLKPGYCEIRLPYRKILSQQHGFFHAGVIGTLADNSGGYAAFTLMPEDSSILTVEYKLNLIAPGEGEGLIARGRVVKSGRTLSICSTEVNVMKGGVESLCATCLMTLIALLGRPDRPG